MRRIFKRTSVLGLAALMTVVSTSFAFAADDPVIYPDGTPVYCKLYGIDGVEGVRATMDSRSVPCEMRITGVMYDNKGVRYNLYAYGESTYGISCQKVTNDYVDYATAKYEAWADDGDYASLELQY